MKTFASALLLASAFAAQGPIDFEVVGTYTPNTDTTVVAATKFVMGSGTNWVAGQKLGDISYSWTLTATSASRKFKLAMVMSVPWYLQPDTTNQTVVAAFQCWKSTTASDDNSGIRCLLLKTAAPGSTAGKWTATVSVFLTTAAASANTASAATFVPATTTAGDLIGASNKGFDTSTSIWGANAEIYKQTYAEMANASPVAVVMQAPAFANNVKQTPALSALTDADLTEKPVYTGVRYSKSSVGGTDGNTHKVVWNVEPAADADKFATNGAKYSMALLTFSGTGNTLQGFRINDAQTISAGSGVAARNPVVYWHTSIKAPTVTSATAAVTLNGNGVAAARYESTTVSKPAAVTASYARVDVMNGGTASADDTLGLVVYQQSTTAAITTTLTMVQQMLCLTTDATAATLQILCFIGQHTISASTLTTTTTVGHIVYYSPLALVNTNFGTTGSGAILIRVVTGLGTTGIDKAEQKAFAIYEASSATGVKPGQEATYSATLTRRPNPKFNWPSGNNISQDRTKINTAIGFFGDTAVTSILKTDVDANITNIKAALVAGGYGGQATTVSATSAMVTSATNIVAAYTAPTCAASTKAVCLSTYTTLKDGALSTIATVGAAIAALAMSF